MRYIHYTPLRNRLQCFLKIQFIRHVTNLSSSCRLPAAAETDFMPPMIVVMMKRQSHEKTPLPSGRRVFVYGLRDKNLPDLSISVVFNRFENQPKYLFSRPSNALPCLASSLAIS